MIVKTPPMGWNTWNTFGHNINEQLIKETADTMVESGLLAAGYNYLVIDDCWSLKKRDENGRLVADPEKFPSGMKAVADYVHSKGLKFGMYSCCGTLTCAQYPGSYDHEFIDAQTFKEWGVDFLKYDHCFKPRHEPSDLLYRKMGLALASCGRDILYSACSWGINETHKWIKSTGAHMWRSTGDISDKWESVRDLYMKNIDLQPFNGHGCFNDMDMLIVGMHGKGNVGLAGCTDEEYLTHFSIWAMLNSPLMVGCDIRSMDEATKRVLLNKDVIAINQDPLGAQPYKIGDDVWIKHLDNGDIAVLIVNVIDSKIRCTMNLTDIGIDVDAGKKLVCKNVWTGEEFDVDDVYVTHVEPHTCEMFRCRIVDR